MIADQQTAPLLECLQTLANRKRAAFHTPGHKQGQGSSPLFTQLLSNTALQADLPELPELDNLFMPEGVIQQAQILAASAFGAEQTWFLANGSTCGIEAAILATCSPGDKLILPRNAHQSAIAALILSGAVPVWVEPDYDAAWNIAYSLSAERLEAAFTQHPDAKAVLVVSPTYHGICGDLAAIAQITHSHNVPLLVDEAHGAHFAFHPDLPTPALQVGADLTVQSIHKTLAALTQAAMLHVQGDRIDRNRLRKALQIVQSSSPNYLLLASLDAARQQMATQGKQLMQQTLALAKQARSELSQIPGLAVLTHDPAKRHSGYFTLDPTRLTIDVTKLGITGFAADAMLHQDLNVTAELPSLTHLTFIITLGNTVQDIEQLISACKTLANAAQADTAKTANVNTPAFWLQFQSYQPSTPLLSPRDAFFAPSVTLPIEQTVNQISAELVCPYPPGIPVLFPGEVITSEALHHLQQVIEHNGMITGCADSSLKTLNVIKI